MKVMMLPKKGQGQGSDTNFPSSYLLDHISLLLPCNVEQASKESMEQTGLLNNTIVFYYYRCNISRLRAYRYKGDTVLNFFRYLSSVLASFSKVLLQQSHYIKGGKFHPTSQKVQFFYHHHHHQKRAEDLIDSPIP